MARKKSNRAPSARASIRQEIEAQRRHLFAADAIVICVQHALDSHLVALDELPVSDALQVASDIINDAAAQLEMSARRTR